jgi:hypothetical protein
VAAGHTARAASKPRDPMDPSPRNLIPASPPPSRPPPPPRSQLQYDASKQSCKRQTEEGEGEGRGVRFGLDAGIGMCGVWN